MAALVDDTVALSRRTTAMEGLVSHQQGQLQDTKEALLRSGTRVLSMVILKVLSVICWWQSATVMPAQASV